MHVCMLASTARNIFCTFLSKNTSTELQLLCGGVLQFVRQPGSQNSEKSRAAKIPTEASVCPTKKKNALAASIFFIFAVKTWHNM